MASVYTNDLRLEEIGSGEQSGSWGDTTNTNLELIAEAFSFGTEAITTNANTHTTTIADGASDPGRSMFLKYTGTLDSACTITIAPNTVSKLWFIENGTSGSQNIIIKQGSGATITIAAGQTKAIYSNGAGSGAAMVDAFASLSVVDLIVSDDLIVGDDLGVTGLVTIGETLAVTGIATFTDDIIIGDGKTIGSASTVGAITIASDGDTTFSADLNVGANFDVTGNAVIDGTALVTGVLTTTAATVFNGGFASNAASTISTDGNEDTLVLKSNDADANAGPKLQFNRNSASPADGDRLGEMRFSGRNDAGQAVEYATFRVFAADVSDGTEDTEAELTTILAGTEVARMTMVAAETVFNQAGADVNFRVETDAQAAAFVIDAGADTATFTNQVVTMTHGGNGPQLVLESTDADGSVGPVLNMFRNSGSPAVNDRIGSIAFNGENDAGNATAYVSMNSFIRAVGNGSESGQFQINTHRGGSNIERMGMLETATIFNDSGADVDFRVETANSANTLFVEGQSGTGTPSIGINNNDPTKIGTSGTAAMGGAAGPCIHISGDDCQIRMDNQALHADNSGNTIFHIRNNYGLTSASAELSLEGGFITFNTGTSLAETARIAGNRWYQGTGGSNNPSASQTGVRISGVSGENFWLSSNAGTGAYNQFLFFNANGNVGNITTSGGATAFNTSSDYRLKENVDYTWDATTRLKQLKPARFNFIADADTTVDGFLAHEAQAVVPQCVTGTKDAMRDEEYEVTPEVLTESGSVETAAVMGTRSVPHMQSIDQSKLVPLLVKTILELEARITALES